MRRILGFALASTLLAVGTARADWDVSQGAKWYQLPDLSPTGMNVNATWNGAYPYVKVLADNFLCTSSGPIDNVHIWGSWLNDVPSPAVTFKLSIHADIPVPPTGGFSQPGPELWSAILPPSSVRPAAVLPPDPFWDPNTGAVLGVDTQLWQYNFTNIPNPFVQLGTPSNPIVYWLNVEAIIPVGDPAVFGWATAADVPHNLDDAVYADALAPPLPGVVQPLGPWAPMVYPGGPLQGQSFDLAFVITPEPATLALFGLGTLLLLKRRH